MNTVASSKRIEYFDFLRIWATFSVILIHVITPYWSNTAVSSYSWQVLNLYQSISRWSVPIFLMISGVLFLGSTRNIQTILRKNVLHIVTTFVFWSALYIGICYAKGQLTVMEAISEFLRGYYHMWYLPVIAGLYLAVPILRKIAESREVTTYFLITAAIFTSLIPMAATCIGFWFPVAGQLLSQMHEQLQFFSVAGYSLYFLLGYFLHSTEICEKCRKRIYALGIWGLIATLVPASAVSLWKQTAVHAFYDYLRPNVVCVSIAVFVFGKYHFHYRTLPPKAISLLQTLSKYSFGVYLAHPLLLDLLRYNLGVDVLAYNPLFSLPITGFVLFVASFFLSGILHHIPVLKKYIV